MQNLSGGTRFKCYPGPFSSVSYNKLFTMKKHFITGLLATFAIAASAQSFTEWQNPEVNAVNRAPMHTNYFAVSE